MKVLVLAITFLCFSLGGGSSFAQFTVHIQSTPNSPVIIGHGAVFSYTMRGAGQAPYTAGFRYQCGANVIAHHGSPWSACFQDEGARDITVRVTDSNNVFDEDQLNFNVLGPDNIELVNPGPSNASNGPGDPLVIILKFKVKRGNEEVGDCWQCPNTKVYEYIAFNGQAPGQDPDQWVAQSIPPNGALDGCSSLENDGYYWASPNIVDKKVFITPGDFGKKPLGHVFITYQQWVAIKVPRCGNTPRFEIAGPFNFQLKKVAGDRVEYFLIP